VANPVVLMTGALTGIGWATNSLASLCPADATTLARHWLASSAPLAPRPMQDRRRSRQDHVEFRFLC
jgi:hypothetical protein